MSHILDSGERTEFSTGAVRDMKSGKGRCDLLPLQLLPELIEADPYSEILMEIAYFYKRGDVGCLIKAIKLFAEALQTDIPTLLLEVSIHYEEGCIKYGERNWEKGIPLHSFIDSGIRHLLKYIRGDKDEPHDRAFVWNMLGAIWTVYHHPELCDSPYWAPVVDTEKAVYNACAPSNA